MKDRLIELLKEADEKCNSFKTCRGCVGYDKGALCGEYLRADYLLANGVIVPPCKVGDTVWFPSEYYDGAYPITITRLEVYEEEALMYSEGDAGWHYEDFGKTVFLTKELAEKELERRKK